MYHVSCQGSTVTFRSDFYRVVDQGYADPIRVCYRCMAIDHNLLRSWSASYKWLQQGKWPWVALGRQMPGMVVMFWLLRRICGLASKRLADNHLIKDVYSLILRMEALGSLVRTSWTV